MLALATICCFSCIKEEAPNDEADILSISFCDGMLRKKAEMGNDYIIVFPKKNADPKSLRIKTIELTAGATFQIIDRQESDTLFFIDVTSESYRYTKRYSVTASYFPAVFDFETWETPSKSYLYENPKEASLQWFSSNNGAALAWNSQSKRAEDYPVRKTSKAVSGNTAVELKTLEGPGKITGNLNIPCLSASLYLGGFNAMTGLSNPLKSTKFGIPFDEGKPERLTGYYIYSEGNGEYIGDNVAETISDRCAIYAVLFKIDEYTQFLYGDNIDTARNIVAKAELDPADIVQTDSFSRFDIQFEYDTYPIPFLFTELRENLYRLTVVFASSRNGHLYEGRIGSTLIIDNVKLEYDEEEY
jgi:hypothetical protein